jgi:phage-related protein
MYGDSPHSGPTKLRIRDADRNWRIIYRLDRDAIVIAEVFAKSTAQTPKHVIATCQRRLRAYDDAIEDTNL